MLIDIAPTLDMCRRDCRFRAAGVRGL